MHLIDSLEVGGAERMAVHSVNNLPRPNYRPHLCVTRHDGPLLDEVHPDVGLLVLNRRRTVDLTAFRRLCEYIRKNEIQVLHAHSSSLYIALAAAQCTSHPAVVWHMHYGGAAAHAMPGSLVRFAARRARAIVVVTSELREWAAGRLCVPPERLFYIPNCAVIQGSVPAISDLPGTPGSRIVCVANLRPEKDHFTLVRAMKTVAAQHPSAHLILVGAANDLAYAADVYRELDHHGLQDRITILGKRMDVPAILAGCDVAVLSSATEGLPLALIEYGAAGLPVVATAVGQCAEVLDGGAAGVVIPPLQPQLLADALLQLLRSPERRKQFAGLLRQRVQQHYSPAVVTRQFTAVYDSVLHQN